MFGILTIVSVLLLTYLLSSRRKANRNAAKLLPSKQPPSVPFRLPFLGNLVHLYFAGLSKRPDSFRDYYYERIFGGLVKTYGSKILRLYVGSHPFVILISFQHIKKVLGSNLANPRFLSEFLKGRNDSGVGEAGIIFNNTTVWPSLRRFLQRSLKDLGFAYLGESKDGGTKPGIFAIREEILSYISYIESSVERTSVWKYDRILTKSMVYNIILRAMTGEAGFTLGSKEAIRMVSCIDTLNGTANCVSNVVFPWLVNVLPDNLTWRSAIPSSQMFIEFINGKIQLVQENKERDTHSLISLFLREMEENVEGFNMKQLEVLLNDISLAGLETMEGVLRWVVVYLSEQTDVQDKIRKEAIEIFKTEPCIESLEINEQRFLYTKAFLLEVLRHQPVTNVTSGPPRVLTEDVTTSDGFLIKKGTNITWTLALVYRDEGYWGDPAAFRPERFLYTEPGGGKLTINKEKAEKAMAIFGFGKRRCPGERMAWTIFFYFTVFLVMELKLKAVTSTKDSELKSVFIQIDKCRNLSN